MRFVRGAVGFFIGIVGGSLVATLFMGFALFYLVASPFLWAVECYQGNVWFPEKMTP